MCIFFFTLDPGKSLLPFHFPPDKIPTKCNLILEKTLKIEDGSIFIAPYGDAENKNTKLNKKKISVKPIHIYRSSQNLKYEYNFLIENLNQILPCNLLKVLYNKFIDEKKTNKLKTNKNVNYYKFSPTPISKTFFSGYGLD